MKLPRSLAVRQVLAAMTAPALLAPVLPCAAPLWRDQPEAPAGAYVLEPASASLVIKLPTFPGLPAPTLRLTKLEGRFDYDPANPDATEVTITADPRSMEASGPMARMAARQFAPDRFPTIAFTSTALRWEEADQGEMVGNLNFHGVTRPLTLQVVLEHFIPDTPTSGARFRFSGHGSVSRSDFGLTQGRPFIGDKVNLVFDMEFVRQPAGEALSPPEPGQEKPPGRGGRRG
jgi:polyisoprenoid-binding protein YceI